MITDPHKHNNSMYSAVYYPLSIDGQIKFLNPANSLNYKLHTKHLKTYIMKTLIITATILVSSLFNNTYGKGTVNINEKLQGIVIFEKGALPIKKNSTEFVKIRL